MTDYRDSRQGTLISVCIIYDGTFSLCSQSEVKDKVIRGQLSQLRSVLPTIKLHLTMCATISNAASKYDFLDLAYPLIDRLTAITHMGYPIR